ncbi:MAG: UDP-N-acetylmuramate dehydrogenase [Corynebacterium sp.]|nr:UDP-N-acetylmuramate dehydrogenase [Corynebacterium sp.]
MAGVRQSDATFQELTTLHLGGKPLATVHCETPTAVAEVVKSLDNAGIPLLIVGGGSNLVVADGEVPVVAVVLACDDIDIYAASGVVHVGAGAVWDEVVSLSVEMGLAGIECLSGIPGTAGATPVQNVGAYGVEIADVLESVQLYERDTQLIRTVPAAELELSYRSSNLKFTNRAVVLGITLRLNPSAFSAPIRFGQLRTYLQEQHPIAPDEPEQWDPATVRAAVLALRASKGMVYDPADVDTWSAGSFFTNPIVDTATADKVAAIAAAETDRPMPRFAAGEGKEKLSAAWLIDTTGFHKGYPGEHAAARLSTKHTLALTNRGNATTADLVALARDVRAGVAAKYGVELHPEPVWVGVSIDE